MALKDSFTFTLSLNNVLMSWVFQITVSGFTATWSFGSLFNDEDKALFAW